MVWSGGAEPDELSTLRPALDWDVLGNVVAHSSTARRDAEICAPLHVRAAMEGFIEFHAQVADGMDKQP